MFPSIGVGWARALWMCALGRHSCVLQHQTGISLWLLFIPGFVSLYLCVETWWTPSPPLDPEQSGAPRSRTTAFNDLNKNHLGKNFCLRRKNAFGLCWFSTQGLRRGKRWVGLCSEPCVIDQTSSGFVQGVKFRFMTPLWKFLLKTHIFLSGKRAV